MEITLNGKSHTLLNSANLRMIVEKYARNKTPVIAELNGTIVRPSLLEQTFLKDGDTLELVSFVGGGSVTGISI